MLLDVLREAALGNLGPMKYAPNNWMKRNCMLCNTQGQSQDTRSRFGIQCTGDSIIVHCFNCSFKASYVEGQPLSKKFKFFLKQINVNDSLIKEVEFEIFKIRNSIQFIREGDETKTQEYKDSKLRTLFDKWNQTILPEKSRTLAKHIASGEDDPKLIQVVDYLFSRRIYDLDAFYWTPISSYNLNERLIIPYTYKGKIVGFTGRLSYNTDSKIIPKYHQQLPKDFVYNLDNQEAWARKYVIVNEGVLDAWVTDGVSTLGVVNQAQIDIINRLQKEVIVCPDRDKSGWHLVKAAIDNDWKVSFPNWAPGIKDAAKASETYGRLLTLHSIISSAVHGSDNITVNWKIGHAERERRTR